MTYQAAEILTELQQRGVLVVVDGDTLCLKPKHALDDALLARVRKAKPAILEALRNRLATCSADCYELEPGIWIHRPWTGCTTVKPEPSGPKHRVAATCWHCQGRKTCRCITARREVPGTVSLATGRGSA